MTANKNLMALRKAGKLKAALKLVARHLTAYLAALKQEQGMFLPVFSTMVRAQSEVEVKAFAAIPAKYFRPDGSIDKRRQRLDKPKGKSFIIKGADRVKITKSLAALNEKVTTFRIK